MSKSLRQKIQESLDRRVATRRRARQARIDAKDITYAISWARTYFNVGAPDTLLDPPTFDMEVDRDKGEITVWPRLDGRRIVAGCFVTYQLCREDGRLVWKGTNPLTGTPIALEVP